MSKSNARSSSSENIDSSEIDALRASAQAELDAQNAPQSEEVAESPVAVSGYVAPVNPNSIRQTILTALLAGQDTKTISATLTERFPASMAAAKSVKHIAYYRSELRKAGRLPAFQAAVAE